MSIRPSKLFIILIILVPCTFFGCTNRYVPSSRIATPKNTSESPGSLVTGTFVPETSPDDRTSTPIPTSPHIPPTQIMPPAPFTLKTHTPAATAIPAVGLDTLAEKLAPEEYWPYIGLVVSPMPLGIEDRGGQYPVFPEFDYAIRVVRDEQQYMLWFERFISQDGEWFGEVVDILVLPTLSEGESIIPTGCSFRGKPDIEIFVIARLDGKAWAERYVYEENIQHAWRANRAAETWGVISTAGIECNADEAFYFESRINP